MKEMKANSVYIRDVTVPILPMPVANGISGCRNDTHTLNDITIRKI
jgi:hypothetical protein